MDYPEIPALQTRDTIAAWLVCFAMELGSYIYEIFVL
jgi:hypothetical protein